MYCITVIVSCVSHFRPLRMMGKTYYPQATDHSWGTWRYFHMWPFCEIHSRLELIFSGKCSLLRWYGEQLECYMAKGERLQSSRRLRFRKNSCLNRLFDQSSPFSHGHVSYPKCTGVEDEQQHEYQNPAVRYLQSFRDCSWSWKSRAQRHLLQEILLCRLQLLHECYTCWILVLW